MLDSQNFRQKPPYLRLAASLLLVLWGAILFAHITSGSPYSSVTIGTANAGFIPGGSERFFLLQKRSGPSVLLLNGCPRREGDPSFASSAEDKTYLYSPYRICLHGMHRATVPFLFKNVMFVSICLCSSPQNSQEDMPERWTNYISEALQGGWFCTVGCSASHSVAGDDGARFAVSCGTIVRTR